MQKIIPYFTQNKIKLYHISMHNTNYKVTQHTNNIGSIKNYSSTNVHI